MKESSTIVGVYDTHDKAITALEALKASGLPLNNMSFISKADIVESKLHTFSNDKVNNIPVEIGVVLGPVVGILAGLSLVTIPGLGLIYGAGAVVGALVGFDFGLVSGGVATLLMKFGINKDKTTTYQEHLENGKFIITIFGDNEITERAKATLHTIGLYIDLQHHQ